MNVPSVVELLEIVSSKHKTSMGVPLDEVIVTCERNGLGIPTDLQQFYEHTNGAVLFDGVFRIVSIQELKNANEFFLPNELVAEPHDLIVFAELEDGDGVAIRDGAMRSVYPVYFLDHEEYPEFELEHGLIANSFTDWLNAALQSDGEWWWLD